MENVNNNVNGNDVVDSNAQIVRQFDGDHQPLVNPNAQVVLPGGGQLAVEHVPLGHMPWGNTPWGHTVVGKFSVPFGKNPVGVVPTGVQTSVVQTPVTTVPSVVPTAHIVPAAHTAPVFRAVPAAQTEKTDKFNGSNFKHWQ